MIVAASLHMDKEGPYIVLVGETEGLPTTVGYRLTDLAARALMETAVNEIGPLVAETTERTRAHVRPVEPFQPGGTFNGFSGAPDEPTGLVRALWRLGT